MKDKKALFTSKSDEWSTPQDFFDLCVDMFGEFTYDPCCTKINKKCGRWSTIDQDGLSTNWSYDRVFCNPPYSQIAQWVEKCATETKAELIALLIPARTDTKYFHEWILPYATEINFVRGRLKFGDSKNSAPFPSMLVIFEPGYKSKFSGVSVGSMPRYKGEKK